MSETIERRSDEELLQQAILDVQSEIPEDEELQAPQYIRPDTQYKFMRELLNIEDSKKIANLQNDELGHTDLSLRGCLKLSLLSNTLGLKETSKYYEKMAEITAATSMSRKGTFLQLLFTQIRKTVSTASSVPFEQKKSFLGFGKNNNQVGDNNV